MDNPCEKIILHDAIECLTAALDAKDHYTQGHSSRVADMSLALSTTLNIRGLELETIHIAAHLHDIGKIGISDRILNKRGKLTKHEWEQIKEHPVIGYNILSKSNDLKEVATIVLSHHERWDGDGYPDGLNKNKIPLGSRIISICDAIDAMISSRPYREALSTEAIICELKSCSGFQFDPYIIPYVDIHKLLNVISPISLK
ncbi:HD domain-containing protein [Alkalibaculum sp. M08DMB]|uniref:HD domain-containing protein n=1 Tax=Alkalibaculum sporogenes TaxID=2655001 RepID=A0A6A7KB14_9FIRM|nr:HD-GYP domain-containing protein [Alkalibaculum sporogenes]MPW26471.1 HD domain-containing protein [Alkalibaculum sporogenes]